MKYSWWNIDSKIVKTTSRALAGQNAHQVGIPTWALITYTGTYDLPRVPGYRTWEMLPVSVMLPAPRLGDSTSITSFSITPITSITSSIRITNNNMEYQYEDWQHCINNSFSLHHMYHVQQGILYNDT